MILSDLAEHLGLRTRAQLLEEFEAQGCASWAETMCRRDIRERLTKRIHFITRARLKSRPFGGSRTLRRKQFSPELLVGPQVPPLAHR